MTVTVKFCGAAGTVTGSSYLVQHPGGRLLVDCGMFQGAKTIRELNYGGFPFDPSHIDRVLLTHAHIDHSGLIPKLCRNGFTGPILATRETIELLEWMLPDSGAIQEAEVARLNRRNARRSRAGVAAIYTRLDAEQSLRQFRPVPLGEWAEAGTGLRARYWNSGHILGGASIELEIATGRPRRPTLRLLFSSDIGPVGKPLQNDPHAPSGYDCLIVESTYGGRERPVLSDEERRGVLRGIVRESLEAGGNLLIPAFAVERTQELLFDLMELMASGELPRVHVFLDSPLAVRATEVFERHMDPALRGRHSGPSPFRAANVRFVTDQEESYQISQVRGGAIIIAGSGMCDAGRIRTHLKNNLWREKATVLLVGYQAPGTLGSLLEQGVKAVRIHGDEVAVNARIRKIDLYSGHADHHGLLDWIRERLPLRRSIFLTHGEEASLAALAAALPAIGIDPAQIVVPRLDETYAVDRGGLAHRVRDSVPPRLAADQMDPALRGRDWHNEYAALALDLQHRLQQATSDRERARLLSRLRRQLDR
ncbi:MAG: MBL fold metallo-hydrolase [Alphaproteobacteria bacterium]|nr:MBL fold metallo-hydrolase [Alphaproteobacteria bacterium]